MTTILDHLDELRAGREITDRCRSCGDNQVWWGPDSEMAHHVRPEDVPRGLKCYNGDCGYTVELYAEPPTILCAVCGEPLDRMIGLDPPSRFFRCEPCGRDLP